MVRLGLAILLALSVGGCGGDSPTSPSGSTPTPNTPTQTLYAITGRVALGSTGGQAISGATVTINDGPNAGKSAVTDGNGRYTISGLAFAGMSGTASAPGYASLSRGIALTQGVTETTINWALFPETLWSFSATGNTVFDIPSYVTRVRIVGTPRTNCENFVVWISGRLVVNVIIGRCSVADVPTYEGTHLITPGVAETRISQGVTWSITEVR